MILGVASGDRPDEYPGMSIDFAKRGELFREAFNYIRHTQEDFPMHQNSHFGVLSGKMDVLPKPISHRIPMLITGYSQQSLEWNAANGDGWMSYPKNLPVQKSIISQWQALNVAEGGLAKPFMQPLYVDLHENDDFVPQHIHLGFRIGINHLIDYLRHYFP